MQKHVVGKCKYANISNSIVPHLKFIDVLVRNEKGFKIMDYDGHFLQSEMLFNLLIV